MVDVISSDDNVYGGVELDAGHFGAAQFHHIVDMVDVVVLDKGEDAAHAAYDAALFAVVDVVSSYDVRADIFLEPAVVLSAADGIALHLRRAFYVLICEEVFVLGVQVFADADSGAFGEADVAVLYYPALGPMRADHAVLEGGGRSPGRGGLIDLEAADGYEAYAGLGGEEAAAADRDLNFFLVGVLILEVGVKDRFVSLLFGVPLVNGGFRIPTGLGLFSFQAGLYAPGFIERLVVHEDAAGVLRSAGEIPVAVNVGGVGIVVAEDSGFDAGGPDRAFKGFPAGQKLGAGYFRAQRFGTAVGYPLLFRPGVLGIDVFAVEPGEDDNFVAWLGDLRGLVDRLKGFFNRAVSGGACFGVNVNGHKIKLFGCGSAFPDQV